MTTNIVALEVTPGTLLRICADSTPDDFARAALQVAGTCGHLASLIGVSNGPDKAPLALLCNHMKTALLQMQDGEHTEEAPGKKCEENKVCISLPFTILHEFVWYLDFCKISQFI